MRILFSFGNVFGDLNYGGESGPRYIYSPVEVFRRSGRQIEREENKRERTWEANVKKGIENTSQASGTPYAAEGAENDPL